MSWESVRNLDKMKKTIVLITNIANQTQTPSDVMFWINDVHESFQEAIDAISER